MTAHWRPISLLAAALLAAVAWLAPMPSAVAIPETWVVSIYTYDAPVSDASEHYTASERGPPLGGYTDTTHAGPAPAADTTTTTGSQVVVAVGVLSLLDRWQVAASGTARTCLNSFTGDTLVLMADGTKKPIKDVRLGDRVMATDPETGETGPRKVVDLIRHGGLHTMVAVRLADGTTIDATDRHPFWVASRGEWVDAVDLEAGDQVLMADGRRIAVENVGLRTEDLIAYNLTVSGLHTYYAGDESVLVHNASCVTSAIGNDPFLAKAAEAAGRNRQVQSEMDNLFGQLSVGNMNPGIGTKALSGTDISYARIRGGARLFFRYVDGGIQIVGKASKANESSVINRLMSIYGP